MRSSTFTASLISAGTLSIAGVALADTPVLDTSTGTPTAQQTAYDSRYMEIQINGTPSGKLALRGLGFAVHADVTMTLTQISTAFKAVDANDHTKQVNGGDGHFVIADLATQQTEWIVQAGWQPGGIASTVLAGTQRPTLERGRDYLITYAGFAPPDMNVTYVSLSPLSVSGALEPLGFGTVLLDNPLSNQANKASWKLEAPLTATGTFPSIKVMALVGDSDNDMVTDDLDNCIDVANESQKDFDLDGVGDACDNCKSIYNPDQDSCSNGGAGGTNPDGDGDGVLDVRDNCPFDANAAQADSDHDGTGDACDGGEGSAGCSALGVSPSLLVALAALLIRRRRR